MAVDNKTLQLFFNKQKKPKIDALVSLNIKNDAVLKNISKKSELNKNENEEFVQKIKKNDEKNDIKVIPNQHQSDTKPTSNQHQTDNGNLSNWYQSNNKTNTKTNTKPVSNQYQINTKAGFFALTGLQKEITITIYKLCQISRDKKTDAVSIIQLSNQCQSTVGAVKIAIHRLIDKNILIRESFKNGRGGWTVYSIPNIVYQEIFNLETQAKLTSNRYQSGTKLLTKPVSKVIPSFPSSSIYINTTTSEEPNTDKHQLSAEWLNIDIEPLSLIGFTKTHLSQIESQNKLSTQMVQDSIYAFAFDMGENNKRKRIKGDPINFFMGILRNGKPYVPPSNYESPQDKAMRTYQERMKEIEKGREAIEKESKDLAYKEWFSKLTDDQKKQYLPENLRRNARIEKNKMLEGSARNYFVNEVWPEKKREIAQETNTTEEGEGIEERK